MIFEDDQSLSAPSLPPDNVAKIPHLYDRDYVIDLCDGILGKKAIRHFCPDAMSDSGKKGRIKLSVHGYYPDYSLAVNYHGRQHMERSGALIDEYMTISGTLRKAQRRKYVQLKSASLRALGIQEVVFNYKMFSPIGCKIKRQPEEDRLMMKEFLLEQIPRLQIR